MHLLSKVLSWLLYAAVIALVVFALCANFLIIAQALFSPLNIVQGNSMDPAIKTNDAVYVSYTDSSQLAVGDIVVFNDPENYNQSIIHRIVGLEEEDGDLYAVTKGDANEVIDPVAVPVESIQGKVRVILPKAGFFLSYLRSIPGFITCVLCPFAVLLLYLIVNWYLEKARPGQSFLVYKLIHGS